MALALALAALAAAGLALVTPRVTASWSAVRAFPFQLDAEEGFILHGAVTLAGGGALYKPLTAPPYLVGNYPPLFYWIYGMVNGPRATLESLPLGRALAQGAALWTALALAAIAALRTRRLAPAMLAGLLFLCSYEVGHWSAFARVDLPALALTITGLGIFLTVRGRWGAVASAVVLVAAGTTRQTALLAPAACVIGLLLNNRRRLAWFLIPYAGLGLGVLAVAQWRTGGDFFRHVVTYNQNVMDWGGWWRVMKNEVWFFYRWWIAALVWGAGALWVGRNQKTEEVRSQKSEDRSQNLNVSDHGGEGEAMEPAGGPARQAAPQEGGVEPPHSKIISIYFLLSALSLLSYAKVGAAPNYVLEPLAAAALWSADALGRMMNRMRNAECGMRNEQMRNAECGMRKWGLRVGAWGFCALLAAHAFQMNVRAGQFRWSPAPGAEDREAGRELLAGLRAAPGDVFCEDPIYTMLAGKPVLWQPFIMSQLAREGKWDAKPVLEWLRARRFGVLVTGEDFAEGGMREYERYTAAMAGTIKENYRARGGVVLPGVPKRYFIWEPKP